MRNIFFNKALELEVKKEDIKINEIPLHVKKQLCIDFCNLCRDISKI